MIIKKCAEVPIYIKNDAASIKSSTIIAALLQCKNVPIQLLEYSYFVVWDTCHSWKYGKDRDEVICNILNIINIMNI